MHYYQSVPVSINIEEFLEKAVLKNGFPIVVDILYMLMLRYENESRAWKFNVTTHDGEHREGVIGTIQRNTFLEDMKAAKRHIFHDPSK